jgi:hypothetical protein
MSLRIAFDCDGVIADLDSALAEVAERLFGAAPPPVSRTTGDASDQPGAAQVGAPPSAAAEAASPAGKPPATGAGKPTPAAAQPPDAPTAEEEQVEPPRFRQLTRQQQHDIWSAVHDTENFWEALKETEPGIVARIAREAREREWEVIFITQRPSSIGSITQIQTQRWLIERGYQNPSVFVIKGTRGKVADALSLDIVVDDRPENCLDVKLESRARAILIWPDRPESLPPNARRLGIEPVPSTNACLDLLTAIQAPKPGFFSRLKKAVTRQS